MLCGFQKEIVKHLGWIANSPCHLPYRLSAAAVTAAASAGNRTSSTLFHSSVAKLLLFSGGQRTRRATAGGGGGGSWAPQALGRLGSPPRRGTHASPSSRVPGPDHLDSATRKHLPSHGEPDARPADGGQQRAGAGGRRAGSRPRAGGRAWGRRGARGEAGWGSCRPTYMEVIFLEMSVMLMLAFPLLFPESCPSRRGKRFPSSGRRQLISVLLQTQFAGQASTEPT